MPTPAVEAPPPNDSTPNMTVSGAVSPASDDLSPNNVRLYVGYADRNKTQAVYLDFPLQVIEDNSNTNSHRKYLEFCASYITGIWAGDLVLDGEDNPPQPAVSVSGGQKWRWLPHVNQHDVLGESAVQIEGLTAKSSSASSVPGRRESMKNQVLLRENECVFTGVSGSLANVMHIMPHRIGNQWLEHMFSHRSRDTRSAQSNVGTLGIDHPRNGLYVSQNIQSFYDDGHIAILAVPNRVLTAGGIPPSAERSTACPATTLVPPRADIRYTLHWLGRPTSSNRQLISEHNVDACFRRDRPAHPALPDRTLVNYAYACRLMTKFGKTLAQYKARQNKVPRPDPSQPSSSQHSSAGSGKTDERGKRHRKRRRQRNEIFNMSDDVTASESEAPPSLQSNEEEPILTEHPDGYGKFGENGRIKAEDLMFLLHRRARAMGHDIWEEPEEDAGDSGEDEAEKSARLEHWLEDAQTAAEPVIPPLESSEEKNPIQPAHTV